MQDVYHSRPRFFCCFPVSWEALQGSAQVKAYNHYDEHSLAVFPFTLRTRQIIDIHGLLVPFPLLSTIK